MLKPPDSNPMPLNNVLASTTASNSTVISFLLFASTAASAFLSKTSRHFSAIASAASVGAAPKVFFPKFSRTVRAYMNVDKPSAIPEVKK